MNDRREALLGRFRASSINRLRKMSLLLIELGEGRGGDASTQEVARELHTLKGESRMLGLEDIAGVAHASEDLMQAARAGKLPLTEAARRMVPSLDVVAASLRGDLGAGGPAALAEARQALAIPTSEAAPEPPRPPEVPAPDPAPAEPREGSGAIDVVLSTAERARIAPQREDASDAHEAERSPAEPKPVSRPVEAVSAAPEPRPNERWVQVNMARIDELCGQLSGFASEFRSMLSRLHRVLEAPTRGVGTDQIGLREDLDRFRVDLEEITSAAWALRLVPVEPMLADLSRHAHDLAVGQKKRVRGILQASGAEVERDILDSLHEPLLHLVRNAIDHGLEAPADRGKKPPEGTLTLEAEPLGASVLISVQDDGRGLKPEEIRAAAISKRLLRAETAAALADHEVLELLFTPGFSTKATISDLSGRGVGLDVVREVVEGLGGSVRISSVPGRGTRFSLVVPSRISKERLLVFRCGDALYGIPSRQVREIMHQGVAVENIAGGRVIRVRDESVPLFSISATLSSRGAEEEASIVILESSSRRYAFSVPSIIGEFELVRQPVDEIVAASGLISASAVLDDGQLLLVLTVAALTRKGSSRALPRSGSSTRKRVLAVDDSAVVRDLVEQVLSEAGFEVRLAEHGRDALEVLEEYQPDLIVTDVEMPIMDGLELLRRVRERAQHLPVIILSSRGAPEDLEKASSLGADGYLVKSNFEATTLLKAVRSFAGGGS